MKKSAKYFFMSMIAFGFFSFQAFAANFQQDKQLLQEGKRYTNWGYGHVAKYKYKAVKVDLSDLPPSPAKKKMMDSLSLVIMKLEDPQLSQQDKKFLINDCHPILMQTLQMLKQQAQGGGPGIQLQNLKDTFQALQKVEKAVSNGNEQRAVRILAQVQDFLDDNYGNGPKLKKAKEALQVIEEKVQDPYLSQQEKDFLTKDCIKMYKQAIKESAPFKKENGIGINAPLGPQEQIGRTSSFSAWGQRSRYLNVGGKKFRQLDVTGSKSSLYVACIEIIFQDGSKEVIGAFNLGHRDTRSFKIQHGNKKIAQLHFVAQSTGFKDAKIIASGRR